MSPSWRLLFGSLCVTLWLAPGSWVRSRAPRFQIIVAGAWGHTSCADRAGVVPLWHASAAVTWVHSAVRVQDYGLQPRMKLALTVTATRVQRQEHMGIGATHVERAQRALHNHQMVSHGF